MKLAVVSDTHDNTINFIKTINWLNQEKIELILHCGDVCRQETIDEAVKSFKGKIYFVRGNGDYDLAEVPEKLEIELGGNPSTGSGRKRIFFNHYPNIAKKAAESGKYDLVFYGHTHKPWAEKIGNCLLANPGELAGQRFKPTFAIYDIQK